MAIQITDSLTSRSGQAHTSTYGHISNVIIKKNSDGTYKIHATGDIYIDNSARTSNYQTIKRYNIILENQAASVFDSNILTTLYTQWKTNFVRTRDL